MYWWAKWSVSRRAQYFWQPLYFACISVLGREGCTLDGRRGDRSFPHAEQDLQPSKSLSASWITSAAKSVARRPETLPMAVTPRPAMAHVPLILLCFLSLLTICPSSGACASQQTPLVLRQSPATSTVAAGVGDPGAWLLRRAEKVPRGR